MRSATSFAMPSLSMQAHDDFARSRDRGVGTDDLGGSEDACAQGFGVRYVRHRRAGAHRDARSDPAEIEARALRDEPPAMSSSIIAWVRMMRSTGSPAVTRAFIAPTAPNSATTSSPVSRLNASMMRSVTACAAPALSILSVVNLYTLLTASSAVHCFQTFATAAAIASPISLVDALPPRSGVSALRFR